jgi:Tol biopolymer transport system component
LNIIPGTRLGPYEVTAAIGAGGMGEVYRARDTRLDRSVAIKVLPERLSSNPQLRERFAREAKAISNLTHPHICALYDIGQSEGADYLVMELLEGESLADRLSRGPLPPEQVIRFGVQIAEALYTAHKQGIVHRDLKPGNVMLTKSGAKLLDFGLASVGVAAPGHPAPEAGAATLATERRPLTEEGTVLGTFQYMAPEQVEGLPADPRTDIFALGATLYEMATGRRAFEGKTRASLIASILDREPPPVSTVAPASPLTLDRVIRTCMAKDPEERWQSAHDVATELRWVADSSSAMLAERGRRGLPKRVLWAVGGTVAGLAIGATAAWFAARAPKRAAAPVARFMIPLPPQAPLYYGTQNAVAISPDGTRIVYRSKDGEQTHLYTRSINQLVPTLIPGTDDARAPSFSPDGRSIAFFDELKLKKVSLDGGIPVFLADTNGGGIGIHWFGDSIYFVRGFTRGVWVVSQEGGAVRQLVTTDPAKGARAVVWPNVLPGGKTILATVWNNGTWDDAKIVAYPVGGGEPKVVVDGGSCARYVPSGHLLFERGGALYAVAFDAKNLHTTSAPVPVINGIASGVTNGEAHYAVSDNGTLLYVPGGVLEDKRSLVWVDRRGNQQLVVPTQRPYAGPAISPDGRTVAVTLETATFDIWQLDLERDSLSRVSFGGDDSQPIWTPDGARIIWSSSRSGPNNIFWAASDNSSGEQRLTTSDHDQYADMVSPDGRLIAGNEHVGAEHGNDIVIVPLSGDHKSQSVVSSRFDENSAQFSPDGKWLTYTSDESGRREEYLRPFPGPGGKWQISVGGADGGGFAHNGREIIYRHGPKFFTVPVETQPRLRIGRPQLLFEKQHHEGGWDLSKDDQRLMLVQNETAPTTNQMQIVLNWFNELERRVPAR